MAGGLTEQDIRTGKTFQRNPFMATFATNALHYRGIGSGIVRILAEYPEIEIVNDVNGKEFKVTIWRKKHQVSTQENKKSTQENGNSTQISTQESIIHILKENPKANRKELAEIIGLSEDGIKKQLAKLKKEGRIERIGSTKAGYWKVVAKQD